MTTVTITWQPVSAGLPDADITVLLWNDDGSFEGFLDGQDDAGAPIWRDVTAVQVHGVTHWAEMPGGPTAELEDETAQAFALADEHMFSLLENTCIMSAGDPDWLGLVDGHCREVHRLTESDPNIAEAFAWLAPRGYVELCEGDGTSFIRILKRPGT